MAEPGTTEATVSSALTSEGVPYYSIDYSGHVLHVTCPDGASAHEIGTIVAKQLDLDSVARLRIEAEDGTPIKTIENW